MNSLLHDWRHGILFANKKLAAALGGPEGEPGRIAGRPIAEGDLGRSGNEANSRARRETDPSLSLDEGEGNAQLINKF